ncbi:DUF4168 domain-containing protein [Sphingobium sp. YR768]|uniref:DUF4168 domain-containing protein n=1 Tax=Sphingobium sp. YR768 TaxID=1884365 RepID=UPI000B822E5D|nr:DUF4168 domain-containing protein [Sphingobium sp. YR768]
MMFTKSIMPVAAFCALLPLAGAGEARAQDATSPAVLPASPPATPVVPRQPGSVTDAELEKYVKAALAVQDIEQDSATPDGDKQARMAAAVQAAGLTPETFNRIGMASQSDALLQQRIQLIAVKIQAGSAPR